MQQSTRDLPRFIINTSLRINEISGYEIMHLRVDELAGGMTHVGEPLREFIGNKKIDTAANKIITNDDRQ